ncbi:hypothetical protein PF005_g1938 [Phytophthora fragariae]|uniref:Carbohydrate kinase PfkB domain-containing protein n=1 Tax=Phytophthora fragariae TaxID=53985 RepID=A0A6A3MFD9_9STRA|nr:hypothetical protein PF011_g1650 [Phytophthora fragariae]KAE9122639.1 hypothetical protein PF007_g7362 [Phytophthora fragariae]KAE9154520.1 hypothetical protein PF006_g1429 [Phytophthora fragariae]KAE9234293.1 hypothetical protein PF005_g1938 [Phytophthora fragariae]
MGVIGVASTSCTRWQRTPKIRSLATRKCRGGNVANALTLGADAHGVDCSLASIEAEGGMPVSYILSSRATGSRTIVHSRNLAELSYEAFTKQLALY